jgi:hypothetical protein
MVSDEDTATLSNDSEKPEDEKPVGFADRDLEFVLSQV